MRGAARGLDKARKARLEGWMGRAQREDQGVE